MTNDEMRHALWRESVGLDAPGTHKIKRFETFSEFLDDQLDHVRKDLVDRAVSANGPFPPKGNKGKREMARKMPAEVRLSFEQLRDELS